jgi:cellulose synthase operon protein B
MKNTALVLFMTIFLFSACDNTEQELSYEVSGQVINHFGQGLKNIKIYYSETAYVLTDEEGKWEVVDLKAPTVIRPMAENYTFQPIEQAVNEQTDTSILFNTTRILSPKEQQVTNWFHQQQLPNGLLESAENSNFVSLYDNALAALVFIMNNDLARAEGIFDFFNGRIDNELLTGNGGFSQFRTANGVPNNNRWLGDNAWLLIALNNYKAVTGNDKYDRMITELSNWMIGLQDTDGGLFGGTRTNGTQIHKITEGNIDAFNAVRGYTDFHKKLLDFLENDRWNAEDKNLMAWVGHPLYEYALDLHPWSYCMFADYPLSALTSADRYLTTQTATVTGMPITGYCFDEEQDVVWLEGTGQMSLAFVKAEMQSEADFYLAEMEKVLVASANHMDAFSFPYASNLGTAYSNDPLWTGADTNPVISSGAWYLFAKGNFNPFEVERNKAIPEADKFWK